MERPQHAAAETNSSQLCASGGHHQHASADDPGGAVIQDSQITVFCTVLRRLRLMKKKDSHDLPPAILLDTGSDLSLIMAIIPTRGPKLKNANVHFHVKAASSTGIKKIVRLVSKNPEAI